MLEISVNKVEDAERIFGFKGAEEVGDLGVGNPKNVEKLPWRYGLWVIFFKLPGLAGERTRDLLISFIFSFHHFTAERQRLPSLVVPSM
jgi:hypothetical protein